MKPICFFMPDSGMPPNFPRDYVAPAMSLAESYNYCERLAHAHYENFTVISAILPRRLQRPLAAVYAYCRCADDLGDEVGDAQNSLALLTWWEESLRKSLKEALAAEISLEKNAIIITAQHPIITAVADVIRQHKIPPQPFFDLLTAFRRDQTQTHYRTWRELLDYCTYSANPVGRIVLSLMMSRGENFSKTTPEMPTPEMLAWSDSICTGLQLINHWQDISRDALRGRCYIPLEIADRFGFTLPNNSAETILFAQKMLQKNSQKKLLPRDEQESFSALMQFLVDDAETRLRSGKPLISAVPRDVRTDIALFILGGLSIARKIRQINFRVWEKRPTLSRSEKIWLFIRAWIFRY